ncbi:hypothetical protein JMJ77_0013314, partial [Colletotrichum scovillei]
GEKAIYCTSPQASRLERSRYRGIATGERGTLGRRMRLMGPRPNVPLLGKRRRAIIEWRRPSLARAGDVRRRLEAPFFLFLLRFFCFLSCSFTETVVALLRFVHEGHGTTVIHLVGYWALAGPLWVTRRREGEKGEHSHIRYRSPDDSTRTIAGRRDGLLDSLGLGEL